ncbi:Fungal Zn2-Cys6 binuclear cluster domain-containing protein [Cladophialophora immunda]|nr:Fungal Zn2-Cys6 binuclear cluster domain-containing protein [Cladophialophora immunda]
MVFNGKPSRSCAHCRRRKLRCDLHKDACGQCVRAGLTCSGYRDPDQLRIRDESQSVIRKARGLPSAPIATSIDTPLVDRARAAFFSHYVLGFAKTYDVLERIGRQAPLDKHLAVSVDAVSLAFFSFQYDAPRAFKPSREMYLSALPLVKNAVTTTEFLASDSTLLAVLLLDLFEKLTNRSPISSESWMSHVKGALALVKLRRPQQLETYVGLRLSVRLFTNMLISCVAGDSPIPPALIKLRSDIQPHVDVNDPKWRVSGLVMKYANFRGAVREGFLKPSDVITQAKRLDSEFGSLARDMPPAWISHRISVPTGSPGVLEHYYDVYPDYFTAQTCNVIRIMRILLNNLIRTTYASIISDSTGVHHHELNVAFASHIIDTMAKEICATGPQFTQKPTHSSPLRKLHCYTLLFPFYVAAMFASPETKVRDWVILQLKSISGHSAIRNASIVAETLEKRQNTSPWSMYAILGSYAFAA